MHMSSRILLVVVAGAAIVAGWWILFENAHALWRALELRGRLHSLALIQRPNGTETTVEFLTVKDGAEPGRHVTVLRETGDARTGDTRLAASAQER